MDDRQEALVKALVLLLLLPASWVAALWAGQLAEQLRPLGLMLGCLSKALFHSTLSAVNVEGCNHAGKDCQAKTLYGHVF